MTTTLVTCEIRPNGRHRGGDSAADMVTRCYFPSQTGNERRLAAAEGRKDEPRNSSVLLLLCIEMCTRLDERLLIFLASGVKKGVGVVVGYTGLSYLGGYRRPLI